MNEPIETFFTHQKMLALRGQLRAATADMLRGKDVFFCDRPVYLNIGDMLIDIGTRRLFRHHGARVIGSASLIDYKKLAARDIPENCVLVFSGGGNLGDLYPRHDELRVTLLSAFPHNPVLVMPQSAFYRDTKNARPLAELLRDREKTLILARDNSSFHFIRNHISKDNVALSPDAAMALYENSSFRRSSQKTLIFRRRDIESASGAISEKHFDWVDLIHWRRKLVFKAAKRILMLQQNLSLNQPGYLLLEIFQAMMYRAACEKFLSARCIDTDRLHGMILAQLLGVPFIARDNSYGKLGSL